MCSFRDTFRSKFNYVSCIFSCIDTNWFSIIPNWNRFKLLNVLSIQEVVDNHSKWTSNLYKAFLYSMKYAVSRKLEKSGFSEVAHRYYLEDWKTSTVEFFLHEFKVSFWIHKTFSKLTEVEGQRRNVYVLFY